MENKKKYTVICPLCEKKLFRAAIASGAEISCPKCRAKLEIKITDGSVQVRETELQYAAQ